MAGIPSNAGIQTGSVTVPAQPALQPAPAKDVQDVGTAALKLIQTALTGTGQTFDQSA
jgi:hypothetical protein